MLYKFGVTKQNKKKEEKKSQKLLNLYHDKTTTFILMLYIYVLILREIPVIHKTTKVKIYHVHNTSDKQPTGNSEATGH